MPLMALWTTEFWFGLRALTLADRVMPEATTINTTAPVRIQAVCNLGGEI